LLYRVCLVPRTRHASPRMVAVLAALAEEPSAWRYGHELTQRAGHLYRLTRPGLDLAARMPNIPGARRPDGPPA
jgi:hypothetical protein